jgi:LmbE family N-acetylglucosaminyl deacetylase
VNALIAQELAGAEGPCLVLSPHLDDAVLSCGALITELGLRRKVTVVSVFTDAGSPPYPFMARRVAGGGDPQVVMAGRREEDQAVLGRIGVDALHLGLPEAPFRRSGRRIGPRATYPTFKFDALRGRVSRWDRQVAGELAHAVVELVATLRPALVLAPLGIGRHVDHLLVREAAADLTAGPGLPGRLWFYGDFPYFTRAGPDRAFVLRQRLVRHHWSRGRQAALDLARGYRSQIPVLFPTGRIPADPEQYWIPGAIPGGLRVAAEEGLRGAQEGSS